MKTIRIGRPMTDMILRTSIKEIVRSYINQVMNEGKNNYYGLDPQTTELGDGLWWEFKDGIIYNVWEQGVVDDDMIMIDYDIDGLQEYLDRCYYDMMNPKPKKIYHHITPNDIFEDDDYLDHLPF